MEKRVVDADPAGGGLGQRGVDGAPLPREDVEGERLGTVPDVVEGILELVSSARPLSNVLLIAATL